MVCYRKGGKVSSIRGNSDIRSPILVGIKLPQTLCSTANAIALTSGAEQWTHALFGLRVKRKAGVGFPCHHRHQTGTLVGPNHAVGHPLLLTVIVHSSHQHYGFHE